MEHKFCVNCLHYKFVELPMGGPVFVECRHPSAPRDPVHGTHALCHDQRASALHCGPEGTRFARKPVDQPQPKPRRWWWPW